VLVASSPEVALTMAGDRDGVPGNEVYLAGSGLACSLGDDVPACLAALHRGGVEPTVVDVGEGFSWPVHAMAREEGTWLERLATTVRNVVAQSGVLPKPGMPLFVASSSLDAGHQEEAAQFASDVQTLADVVARALGWQGPVFTVSTACTSSVNAVLAATELIRGREVTEALVLGIEFSNRFTVGGFGSMQLLSPDRAQPFGLTRNGLVLGEAVAALHLRAAPARWRIAGGANVVDGGNPTGANSGAVAAACEEALRLSGIGPGDIDLIKPQAAGSPGNDAIEAAALQQVFGTLPPLLPLKEWIGHTLGAAGAAELVLVAACLESGVWPVSAHALDPALGIQRANHAPASTRYVLLNAIGFGGGHAALVLEDSTACVEPPPQAQAHANVHGTQARHSVLDTPAAKWRIAAHVVNAPPPPDWREALAKRLGYRPRRLGPWAELGMHGALQCLDAAGVARLPSGARLRVASLSGPLGVTRTNLSQFCNGVLPLPFAFMQTQPGSVLAALCQALGWQGDAAFLACRDAQALQRLALQGAGPQGVLLGWMEEDDEALRSEWRYWLPA
jgi:3-oxoacyl-[acyl-carrier-protein] synthase-1